MRRVVLNVIPGVLLLLAAVAAGGYVYLRRSLPQIDGAVTVAGLSAPIEIIRDADAIPHIIAGNKLDALFGLGYVHAQDRLWQMEFQRRIGHGRLSEVFGAATIAQDRFLRTAGFGRAARSAWAHLPADARAAIDAYVAGINAFVSTHHGRALPPEFTLLRFEPEPFTGPDVLAWVKMMAWDLSANYSFELLRHDMLAAVGPERMAELLPPYPHDALTIVPKPSTDEGEAANRKERPPHTRTPAASGSTRAGSSWSDALVRGVQGGLPDVAQFLLGGARTEALGSNNWVVDGARTATG